LDLKLPHPPDIIFRGFSVGKHGAIIERGPSRASMRFTAAQQLVRFWSESKHFSWKGTGLNIEIKHGWPENL
jgi:hypothetical protein